MHFIIKLFVIIHSLIRYPESIFYIPSVGFKGSSHSKAYIMSLCCLSDGIYQPRQISLLYPGYDYREFIASGSVNILWIDNLLQSLCCSLK